MAVLSALWVLLLCQLLTSSSAQVRVLQRSRHTLHLRPISGLTWDTLVFYFNSSINGINELRSSDPCIRLCSVDDGAVNLYASI